MTVEELKRKLKNENILVYDDSDIFICKKILISENSYTYKYYTIIDIDNRQEENSIYITINDKPKKFNCECNECKKRFISNTPDELCQTCFSKISKAFSKFYKALIENNRRKL